MRNFKKITICLLGFILALSLCACNDKAENEGDPLKEALSGRADFVLEDENGGAAMNIKNLASAFVPDGARAEVTGFALLTPQKGGDTVAVVKVDRVAGDMGGYLVLYAWGDGIKGAKFDRRAFDRLREDASFIRSNAAGSWEKISRIRSAGENGLEITNIARAYGEAFRWTDFEKDGRPSDEETYLEALNIQNEKSPAQWHDLTEESINALF